jgi:hypothetical protein
MWETLSVLVTVLQLSDPSPSVAQAPTLRPSFIPQAISTGIKKEDLFHRFGFPKASEESMADLGETMLTYIGSMCARPSSCFVYIKDGRVTRYSEIRPELSL